MIDTIKADIAAAAANGNKVRTAVMLGHPRE